MNSPLKHYKWNTTKLCSHHIPAVTFESVLNKFSNRYCLGLTATSYRKDGHQPILYMQCGPICYEIKEDGVLFNFIEIQ